MLLHTRTVKALPVLVILITLSGVQAQEKMFGVFEGKNDVGSPARAGSTQFDADKQEYRLEGAGSAFALARRAH